MWTIWAVTDQCKSSVIKKLKQTYNIRSEQQDAFKYFGIYINQLNKDIYLNQLMYEDFIEPIYREGSGDNNRSLIKR